MSLYSNDILKTHDLSKFLRDHESPKGGQVSLTAINGGRWDISDEEYPKFFDLLNDFLFVKKHAPLGLVEKRPTDGTTMILVDHDFRYPEGKVLDHDFNIDNIKTFIQSFTEAVDHFYNINKPVRFFIFLRPQAYISTKRQKDGTTRKEIKDGSHIVSPDIVLNSEAQQIIRLYLLKYGALATAYKGVDYINKDDEVYDEAVVKKNGWFFYGESKPNIPAYSLQTVYIYDPDTQTFSEDEDWETAYDQRSLMELLSIRYNLGPAWPEIPQKNEAEYKRFLESKLSISITPVTNTQLLEPTDFTGVDETPPTKEAIFNAQTLLSYLSPAQTTREHNLVRHLVMDCFNINRAEDYAKWREVGWCLHNICQSEDMFNIWIEFSNRSKKGGFTDWTKERRDWDNSWGRLNNDIRKRLNKGSLHYWAREDNLRLYEEIIRADLVEWVAQGKCRNTHNHVAQLMKAMFMNQYCVAMDSKTTEWYEYKDHMWHQLIQGIAVRRRISAEVANIVIEGRTARRKRIQDDGGEPGKDEIFKELLALEKNLYQCPFKEGVMKEAAHLFYEENFEDKLNNNPTLLGCGNCILDLKVPTGEKLPNGHPRYKVVARQGRADDYISFQMGNIPSKFEALEYIPFEKADPVIIAEIIEFFSKLFPDPEVREYVLTLASSCLIGANHEQCFYFLTGIGGNGKSKFIELMKIIFGDYGRSLNTTAMTRKRPDSGSANPDIIVLKKRRFIYSQEPDSNEPLNTSRMKQFSGEDDVDARGLFKDQCQFQIMGKIFVCCNKLPAILAMDEGTWRRIRALLFASRFVVPGDPDLNPEAHVYLRDPGLDDKIKNWRSAFFSLLVHYYETRYLVTGINKDNTPASVMNTCVDYKKTYDNFARFKEACFRVAKTRDEIVEHLQWTKIWKVYKSWYDQFGVGSGARLKEKELKERCCEVFKVPTDTKTFRGLYIFNSEEDAEEWDKEQLGQTTQ